MAFDEERYSGLIAERNRVSAKLETSTDKDVRRALEAHLLNLAGEILELEALKPKGAKAELDTSQPAQTPNQPEPTPEEEAYVAPTPEQVDAADKLVAPSRAEGRR